MTRIVSMNRDELDRRIAKAVAAATKSVPTTPRSYRPRRDPETGMIEMVPVDHRPWGMPGTSPAVVAAVGPLRYDRCADDRDPDGRDFAIIGLVRSSEFLAGHADEEDLGRFARDFVTIARGHADGSISDDCCLVLDFQTSDTGLRLSFCVEMTAEAVVFSTFDRQTGKSTMTPVAFYCDAGVLGREEADFSLTLDTMRKEHGSTQRLLAGMRRTATPAPVLRMDAFRARRAG